MAAVYTYMCGSIAGISISGGSKAYYTLHGLCFKRQNISKFKDLISAQRVFFSTGNIELNSEDFISK